MKIPELESYFNEAASWDADRIEQRTRSMRSAWWVAAGAGTCAMLSSAALFALMPLKRVEPFVVRVSDTTGVVDVVPVYAGSAEMPEAVSRYFLNHYVTVCERFNFATAESDYSECGAFHGVQRNQAWVAAWDRSNPKSPLNVHKDGSTISVQVSAISFFTRASGREDLAQVRYVRMQRMAGGAKEERSHWIATVQYAYATPSKDPSVRRWNPLGFRILEFEAEPETLTPDVVSASGSSS